MTTTVPITTEDVDAIVTAVWESLTGTSDLAPAPPAPITHGLVGTLQVTGPVPVEVRVSCASTVAHAVTTALLTPPPGQHPSAEDLHDTVGEIANIIAGNIKALLPEPSTLSLPQVQALPSSDDPSATHLLTTYTTAHGPFTVALTAQR